MKKNKILFVASVTGHINVFHLPYLKWFKEKGYEVHVASKGNQEIPYCDKHFELSFERFPLKIKNIKVFKQLKKIINENDYEIIHSHTPVAGVLARIAAKKSRKRGTKSIYTAHGFHFYKGAPLLNWIIYFPIEKICARYTDCLITINKEDFECAKKHFKINQIEYINGVGIDTNRFEKELTDEEKKEFRNKLKIKENDIVFSYVAELNKNKNQTLLINAIKELKKQNENIKLLLVGPGPLYNFYRDIIEKEKLKDNVMLLGKRADINEILSITNIYLASSLREGLPVNVMEAMYKGLPIIATDNRGHRELVEDSLNGYIIHNTCEIVDRINTLLQNESLMFNFKNRGKEKCIIYEIESVIKSMKKIYENIVREVS